MFVLNRSFSGLNSLYVVLITFMAFACADDMQGRSSPATPSADAGSLVDADMNSDPEMLWEELESCQLTGRSYITKVEYDDDECASLGVEENDGLVVSNVGGSVSVSFGSLNLPILDVSDCVARFGGCLAGPSDGELQIVNGTLGLEGAEVALTMETERYEDWRQMSCQSVLVRAQASDSSCHWPGQYFVAQSATLSSGTCDLTWESEVITIEVTSPTESQLSWGAPGAFVSDFSDVVFDDSSCSLSATRQDLFVFNGVVRETTIEAQLAGDTLNLTIQDRLEGTDDFGNQCAGASFTATGERILPTASLWNTSCEPLPYVCGDSVCSSEAGEDCSNCDEDCGCVEGDFCYRFTKPQSDENIYACTRVCDDDASACHSGESCVLAQEFGRGVDLAQRVCFPEAYGDGEIGGPCENSLDCKSGLLCSDGACRSECESAQEVGCGCYFFYGAYACHRACDRMNPDNCGPGGYCGEARAARICTGSMPMTCSPSSEHEFLSCFPGESQFGDACPDGVGCGLDLACVGEDCQMIDAVGIECVTERCSRECASDADCEAPLPYCWTNPNGGKSYCVSHQAN